MKLVTSCDLLISTDMFVLAYNNYHALSVHHTRHTVPNQTQSKSGFMYVARINLNQNYFCLNHAALTHVSLKK